MAKESYNTNKPVSQASVFSYNIFKKSLRAQYFTSCLYYHIVKSLNSYTFYCCSNLPLMLCNKHKRGLVVHCLGLRVEHCTFPSAPALKREITPISAQVSPRLSHISLPSSLTPPSSRSLVSQCHVTCIGQNKQVCTRSTPLHSYSTSNVHSGGSRESYILQWRGKKRANGRKD